MKKYYKQILEELDNLKVKKEPYFNNVLWLPCLCSKAEENSPLIFIEYESNKDRIRLITGKKLHKFHQSENVYIFDKEKNITNIQEILSIILNYYFENIDENP